eukprot:Phypoly_transcript_01359.p1 GENE.Phypoly_transcript_01359~~Phypoly_transcript_01359.p1  ORF type:complete len:805 (+),score=137.01 Phypoly_transcript_01359:1030-3444(+)
MFDKALIVLLAFIALQCNSLPMIPSRIHDVNSSLYWGTYRPNLYFGTKTRSPTPLTTGLMWFSAPRLDSYKEENVRHACEQHDKLKRYGWMKHDGKNYGKQEIEDPTNKVTLNTEFIKYPGGKNGGEWALKIKGVPSAGAKPGKTLSLMYYVAAEDPTVDLKLSARSGGKKKGIEGDAFIKGKSKELGDFIFVMQDEQGNTYHTTPDVPHVSSKYLPEYEKAHYLGVESTPEKAWKVKELVHGALSSFQRKAKTDIYNAIARHATEEGQETKIPVNPEGLVPVLPNTVAKKNQIIVIQKVLKVPFEVDIVFISGSAHSESITSLLQGEPQILDPAFLRSSLDLAEKAFDEKFEETFHLTQKGYSAGHQKFAKFTLSNLIGGIGYWHGSSIVAAKEGLTYSAPRALYSAVPSRPFFPRGFLWDEGFHQLIISKWDPEITMEVVTSWLNSMDENGWMEREQILGEEARSKVPREFQTQFPDYANPPTLLFPILKLAEKVLALKHKHSEGDSILPSASHFTTESKEVIEAAQQAKYELFLAGIIDRLELNFQWFLKTQNGETPNTFRWRGRTVNHSLTSGLDDYPREGVPTENEHHLDLLCWMANSARALSTISKALGRSSTVYDDHRKHYLKALEEVHWNKQSKSYADLSTHIPSKEYLVHDGYISIFPLLLGLIPHDSPKLGLVLDVVRDPAKLWSQYGILSLSRQDTYFGTHENYWRGAIWININYLLLSSLHNNYIGKTGPHQEKCKEIYNNLRTNIIENMYKNYEATGYVWEQYNPQTGEGQRSHPFTGWSSLVLLIMAESY